MKILNTLGQSKLHETCAIIFFQENIPFYGNIAAFPFDWLVKILNFAILQRLQNLNIYNYYTDRSCWH